jgi:hypothetical protein
MQDKCREIALIKRKMILGNRRMWGTKPGISLAVPTRSLTMDVKRITT